MCVRCVSVHVCVYVCARVHTCAQQKIQRYSERNRNQCGRRDPDAGTVKEERLRVEKKIFRKDRVRQRLEGEETEE